MSKSKKIGKKILVILASVLGAIVLLYLFLITPRLFSKPDTSGLEGWMYTHRGFHDNLSDAPENSLKSFEKAIENGYGIELDVQLSKDGIPMVFHDTELERVCGVEGDLKDYTCEQLQELTLFDSEERIPTLKEAMDLIDGKVPVIVEYKGESLDVTVAKVTDQVLCEYDGVYCIQLLMLRRVR